MITGDAVVVDLPAAGLATRCLAFTIDVALLALGFGLILLGCAAAGLFSRDDALAGAVALVLILGLFVGVPVTVETLSRGRSLGKLALGLRVVRDDGGPIRFRHAFVRGLTGLIADFGALSGFTGAIALISSLVSVRGQRLGDRLAGTVVVRERAPSRPQAVILMPPPLAGWATSVTLSQLPDGLALAARQFLVRAPGLDPRARMSMASSLASEVGSVVGPPPPPGTPAEAFLAAVLAERSRREAQRLATEQRHLALTPRPPTPAPPVPEPRATAPEPAPVMPPDGGFAPPR